jgi:putative FmdB family regulatory protein
MPNYDYRCPKCGTVKNAFHGMNESPLVKCDCGKQMDKQIGAGLAVHYYGPGWTKSRKPVN